MTKTAIINAHIIDGTGNAPLKSGTVIINNKLIETIGKTDKISVPKNCKVIDLKGKTVLPGFIDGHMHVSGEPGRLDHLGHIRNCLLSVEKLKHCLKWGTTTVVHAAGSAESAVLADLIKNDQISGCSDLVVGGAVTATGGHVRGRSADGIWEIRKAVREMIRDGVDHIKTCATGGFQWEHEKLSNLDYTLEELSALVDEAHIRGRRVHVHAHAQPGLQNAINAGCDVILHGALIDTKALDGIAKKRLWYMPTLNITSDLVIENKNFPEFMRERMKNSNPIHRAGVVKAHKMGINIAAGTDGWPGSIMHELCEMVDCGLSPMDAIVTATRNTADTLGILDKTGTLEAGKRADLFAVNGNPLKDISILKSQKIIKMVIKDGVSVS